MMFPHSFSPSSLIVLRLMLRGTSWKHDNSVSMVKIDAFIQEITESALITFTMQQNKISRTNLLYSVQLRICY